MREAGEAGFDHDDRRRLYGSIERAGSITADELRDRVELDERAVRHHLGVLKRDGRIETVDGELRIAFDAGPAEEHRADGLAFTIRPARQDDLAGIVGVIRQVAAEGSHIEAESVAALIDHEDLLHRDTELTSRVFFVATVDGEVVGWVHLESPGIEKLKHTAKLTIGVLEEYRDRGIGGHLLERATSWAASRGYEKLYNATPAINDAAIAFLEEHGWRVEAVREDHYRIGEEYVDEVMMARRLDSV